MSHDTGTLWRQCLSYLRHLWSKLSNEVSDDDVRRAEDLVRDVHERHTGLGRSILPAAHDSPDDSMGGNPAEAPPLPYRSTPDPAFGSRSLAQRRERELLQRELIRAEAEAAMATTSPGRPRTGSSGSDRSHALPPPGKAATRPPLPKA